MADKNKLAVTIKSDGTAKGTSLVVNGADVTKSEKITYLNFTAYGDGSINVNWTSCEKDDKGVEKRTNFSYSSPRSPAAVQEISVTKSPDRVFIGQDSQLQFETEQDEKTFKISGHVKKLQDSVTIKEVTDESPKI